MAPTSTRPSLKDPELYDRLVAELRARAKELGLSGYSSQRKGELIDLLRHH